MENNARAHPLRRHRQASERVNGAQNACHAPSDASFQKMHSQGSPFHSLDRHKSYAHIIICSPELVGCSIKSTALSLCRTAAAHSILTYPSQRTGNMGRYVRAVSDLVAGTQLTCLESILTNH